VIGHLFPAIEVRNTGKATKRKLPTTGYGSKRGAAKIPFSTVCELRREFASGTPAPVIAAVHNLSQQYVFNVIYRGERAFR
jgi:hypothetical protein